MAFDFYQPQLQAVELQQRQQQLQYDKQADPLRLDLLKGQARLTTAEANQKESDTVALKKAAMAVQNAQASGEKLTAADALTIQANELAASGNPTLAGNTLMLAERAQTQQERQDLLKEQRNKLQQAEQIQRLQWMEAALEEVKDQPSLDKAVQSYEALHSGDKVPEEYKTYDPAKIDALRRTAMTMKDRATLSLKEQDLLRKEEADKKKDEQRKRQLELEELRVRIQAQRAVMERDRKEAVQKEGGKNGQMIELVNKRLSVSATEAARSLENLSRVSTGLEGQWIGSEKGTGSLFSMTKRGLAQTMTEGQTQQANVYFTGLSRNLAQLEAVGAATGLVGLSEKMEVLKFTPGDTLTTRITKLAEARQIVEAVDDVIQNDPKTPDNVKDDFKKSLTKIRKAVPLSNPDILDILEAEKGMKGGETLGQYMQRKKDKSSSSGGHPALPPGFKLDN